MVPLPLFKLGSLFLRHVSKYGANRIKKQAHDHMRFRAFAARYGQMMHQLNMRLSVALLRDTEAERRAKEKAEAPTVKTEQQTKRDDEAEKKRRKSGGGGGETQNSASSQTKKPPLPSIWTRRFRQLPEDKAVDLFADVVGDAFILSVAVGLILYETWRSGKKPDANKERIDELARRLDEREAELREAERRHAERLEAVELALRRQLGAKSAEGVKNARVWSEEARPAA